VDTAALFFSRRVAVFMEADPRQIDSALGSTPEADRATVADDLMFYRSSAHEFLGRAGVEIVRVEGRPRVHFQVGGEMKELDFSSEPTLDVIVLYEPPKQPRAIAPVDVDAATEYFGLPANPTNGAVPR
jgi:hypothetical protein